jgi:phosphoribosylamine--glycine ligase
MNVAVIGSGGREHALAYRIRKSIGLDNLFLIPGNPGTASLGENVSLDVTDHKCILDFCKSNSVEFVVVGPEIPLVEGLGNFLRENGLFVFGPDSGAAAIEGDKTFAKELMKKYNIPTADFVIFNSQNSGAAFDYIKDCQYPAVIKASGLAAGKGVLICNTFEEAKQALEDCFSNKVFGDAGDNIVIEEFMSGQEASIFAVTDGTDFICLPSAQDHKRIGDNDTGKNTGGMGAYSPAPVVTPELLQQVENEIIKPTLEAMKNEGKTFVGCLYCGLMITEKGPKVVEFNCRFGDPETQAVLPLLEGNFLNLLYSAACGKLDKSSVSYSGGSAVCVVAASKGYPDKYEKGFEIKGLDEFSGSENIIIFHAGTKFKDDKIVTNGGRVLGITAVIKENDLGKCKKEAYSALQKINFDNIYFRTDIADKGIAHLNLP